MTIKAEIFLPEVDGTNVPLNTEIAFRLYEDGGLPLEEGTIDVFVDQGGGSSAVMIGGGNFVGDWTGEFIDNNPGQWNDYTIILIRPVGDPIFRAGATVTVDIAANLM
jgi:hypothetical protein